eukprot:10181348-Lingulodinium_polyedra.AAC.1
MGPKPKPKAADSKRGNRAKVAKPFTPGDNELMSEESAKVFLPPNCSLCKDFANQRWLLRR